MWLKVVQALTLACIAFRLPNCVRDECEGLNWWMMYINRQHKHLWKLSTSSELSCISYVLCNFWLVFTCSRQDIFVHATNLHQLTSNVVRCLHHCNKTKTYDFNPDMSDVSKWSSSNLSTISFLQIFYPIYLSKKTEFKMHFFIRTTTFLLCLN